MTLGGVSKNIKFLEEAELIYKIKKRAKCLLAYELQYVDRGWSIY